MSPPDDASSTAEPPNVFRQALICYVAVLFALALSFALGGAIAGVLDAPMTPFVLLIAPLLVLIVLFVQIDTLIERRWEAGYPEAERRHDTGGHSTASSDD